MKLKVTNNWENLFWHIGEIEVTAALKKITLEFPDGTVETFNVTWTLHVEHYYEMGTRQQADQYEAFITVPFNGIKISTSLEAIAKKRNVKVIDFKVKRP